MVFEVVQQGKDMRTLEGGNVHKQMMMLAKDYLEKQGYTVVLKAQVNGTGIIDVLGIKGSEKVAVECQLLPSASMMQRKLLLYRLHITKLMLAIPKNVTAHNIPAEIEVLQLDVERTMPTGKKLVLTVSEEADKLLRGQNGDMSKIIDAMIKKEFAPKPDPSIGQPTS